MPVKGRIMTCREFAEDHLTKARSGVKCRALVMVERKVNGEP
jgi:hypothetical protein